MAVDARAWLARFENPANWVEAPAYVAWRAARYPAEAEPQTVPETAPVAPSEPAREVA
jgi:hypothetical protein